VPASDNHIENLVRVAAQAASEKKATDVVAIRVSEVLVVTDYFLIATGANDRQVHAIGTPSRTRCVRPGSSR